MEVGVGEPVDAQRHRLSVVIETYQFNIGRLERTFKSGRSFIDLHDAAAVRFGTGLDRLKPDATKRPMHITLNGEPFEFRPRSPSSLCSTQLDIDARRVAVEHNLADRQAPPLTETSIVDEGDEVEIVNFVGGG